MLNVSRSINIKIQKADRSVTIYHRRARQNVVFIILLRFLRTQRCTSGRASRLVIGQSSAGSPKLERGSCWLHRGTLPAFPTARTDATTTVCRHRTFLVCAWPSNITHYYNLPQLGAGDGTCPAMTAANGDCQL